MKTQPTISQLRALPFTLRQTLTVALLPALLSLLTIDSSRAGSATWAANPGDNYWHEAANWTPQTVPDGPSDIATFATSSNTFIYLDDSVELDGIIFNPGASAFTIPVQFADISLTFNGSGITNNSGIVQNFYADGASDGAGYFYFHNSATAGTMTSFTIVGGSQSSLGSIGFAYFYDTSTAGNASFTLTGGTGHDCNGGVVFFRDSASVGNERIPKSSARSADPDLHVADRWPGVSTRDAAVLTGTVRSTATRRRTAATAPTPAVSMQ